MANLFAQLNDNWDAVNQWNTVANGSGSFVTPGVNDVCMANGKTVNINISVTVSQIRNDGTGGATTNGVFNLSDSITVTANSIGGSFNGIGYTNSMIYSGNFPNSIIINANIYNCGTIGCATIRNSGSGTIYLNGSIIIDGGNQSVGVVNGSIGKVIIIGNISGGSYYSAGLSNSLSGTVEITGNIIGGSRSNSLFQGSGILNSGTLSIVGNVNGGSFDTAAGIYTTNGYIGIIGTATGGNTTNTFSIYSTLGTIVLTGNVYGGSGINSPGLYNVNATITIYGNSYGSTISYGIYSTGFLNLFGTVIAGPGRTGNPGVFVPYSASTFSLVSNIQFDPSTANAPIYGYVGLRDNNTPSSWKIFGNDSSKIVNFYTPTYGGGGNPVPNNVRYNVTYGPDNSAIGTLKVPTPDLVSKGAATDNTVGTAILTQEKLSEVISTIWSQG